MAYLKGLYWFLKIGQPRALFAYFRSFHNTMTNLLYS